MVSFFFFNDTATTEIYTLSLHDALPISREALGPTAAREPRARHPRDAERGVRGRRSEEHTSELQSQSNLVCRLLLEKKKKLMTICGSAVSGPPIVSAELPNRLLLSLLLP